MFVILVGHIFEIAFVRCLPILVLRNEPKCSISIFIRCRSDLPFNSSFALELLKSASLYQKSLFQSEYSATYDFFAFRNVPFLLKQSIAPNFFEYNIIGFNF